MQPIQNRCERAIDARNACLPRDGAAAVGVGRNQFNLGRQWGQVRWLGNAAERSAIERALSVLQRRLEVHLFCARAAVADGAWA